MSTLQTILLTIISSLPGILVALATLISTIRNGKQLNTVGTKLEGRLSELIHTSNAQTNAAGIAAGYAQGRQDQREIQASIDAAKLKP